jgi:hypothetical protein
VAPLLLLDLLLEGPGFRVEAGQAFARSLQGLVEPVLLAVDDIELAAEDRLGRPDPGAVVLTIAELTLPVLDDAFRPLELFADGGQLGLEGLLAS